METLKAQWLMHEYVGMCLYVCRGLYYLFDPPIHAHQPPTGL